MSGSGNVLDVIPYLVLAEAEVAIDFVKDVFGAAEVMRGTGSQRGVHCELLLGGRRLMIGGGGQWSGTPSPGAIHLFVDDVDATYARAVAAGAKVLHAPADQEYGLREASVQDPFGNHWYVARDLGRDDFWQGVPALMPYFHPAGASKMIDFLSAALDAQVLHRFEDDGRCVHARLRAGQAMLELGEAHGDHPAMPMHLFVTVKDADAAYDRAVSAGAKSNSAPSDAPFGRIAAADDQFGNRWYLVAEK